MGTMKSETMKTLGPASEFTPTDLVSPDGCEFTPGILPEYNEPVA
ncbi:hypothetical protein [Rhodococcoides fascians]|nr:hypothetical protein [Rhodococcus fascians]